MKDRAQKGLSLVYLSWDYIAVDRWRRAGVLGRVGEQCICHLSSSGLSWKLQAPSGGPPNCGLGYYVYTRQ